MIVALQQDHLRRLDLQKAQSFFGTMMNDPEYLAGLVSSGPAYTLLNGDEVLACAGIVPQWQNRAMAWALVGANAGRAMVALHRAVLRCFEIHPCRRIETTVASKFPEGHRWARMLGFEREGTMTAFAPDGADYDLYARIQWHS